MPVLTRRALVAVCAMFVVLGPLGAALGAGGDHDRWYVIEMMGQRAGWMHDTGATSGETYTGRSEMALTIKRGQIAIEIAVESEFVETLDGKPVSMRQTMKMGGTPTVKEYRFTPEGVEVSEGQGEQRKTKVQGRPEGEWLTPRAAQEFVEKRLEAGAKEISVRSIDAATGLVPAVTTRKVLEATTAEALGKTVPAIKWSVTTDRFPGIESIEYVDERGVSIRSETNLGGIGMVMILADKDLARSKLDPPELMVSTLVTPDRAIDGARRVREGSFLLNSKGERLGDLPSEGVQRTERVDAKTVRVTVDLDRPGTPAPGEAERDDYLEPSTMVGSDDAEVKRLTEGALAKAGKGESDRAEALRRFVHEHIDEKSLGVGFATASETARTKAGDCSEHATLLAAMLRAAEIPSRAVSGLVYADHFAGTDAIFGYHMWTQALIDPDGAGERKPEWVDLDATLGPETPFDATHISLAVSSLSDEETTNAMVALAPLIGTLEIKVERAE